MKQNRSDRFDAVLRNVRRCDLPRAPEDLENRVLRRVRAAAAQGYPPLQNGWQALLRPSVVAAALALAVVSSAAVTSVTARDIAVSSDPEADPLELRVICDPSVLDCFYHNAGFRFAGTPEVRPTSLSR